MSSGGDDNSFQKFSPLRESGSQRADWSLKRKPGNDAKVSFSKRQQLIEYPAFTQIDPKLASKLKPIYTDERNPFEARYSEDEDDPVVAVLDRKRHRSRDKCDSYEIAPVNPFAADERELNRQMRLEHQRQREMLAKDQLEGAFERRERLTPGLSKVKRLMEEHRTNEDLTARVNADFNHGLIFVPVVSPATDHINTALGIPESDIDEPCYGCETGLEAKGITSKMLDRFHKAMEQIEDGAREPVERYKLISRHWEVNVKRKANKGIRPSEQKVKSWTPASIKAHYESHVQEPSVVKGKILRDWRELYHITHSRRVFLVSAQFARTGRKPTMDDMYTSSEGLAQLKLCSEMIIKLMSVDERKMPGYRPELHYSRSAMGVLANQRSELVQETDINPALEDRADWRIK